MIPYYPQPSFSIGPYTAHAWGLMVFLGLMLGLNRMENRVKRFGGSAEQVSSLGTWAFLIGMLVVGHVFEFLVYHPEDLINDPLKIFNLTTGFSSFGGFLGGWGTVWFLCRRRKISYALYGESVVYGLTVGWILGRLGCFLAHDHIGVESDFFLAVNFPDGPAHDLGFYEMLFTIVLAGIWTWRERNLEKDGVVPWRNTAITLMLYGPVRWFLDSLRISDTRYLGWTPGQWSSLATLVGGVVLFMAGRNWKRLHPGAPGALPPDEANAAAEKAAEEKANAGGEAAAGAS